MKIKKYNLLALCIFYAWCLAIFAFLTFPEIDIAVSSLFFNGDGIFLLQSQWYDDYVRNLIRPIVFFTPLTLAIIFLILRILKKASKKILIISKKINIWCLFQYIIAIYFVDFAIKPLWGRARPKDIFNENTFDNFSPVYLFSDYCNSNCSFMSSDVTFVAGFIALPLLFVSRYQNLTIIALQIFTALTALGRIASGAHFLSDVIFADLFIITIAVTTANMINRKPQFFEKIKI